MPRIPYIIFAVAIVFSASSVLSLIQISERYYVFDYNATFLHALAECKIQGMALASPKNATAQTNITNFLTGAGFSSSGLFWLGGIRRDNNQWIWIQTGDTINYTNWADNEPNYTNTSDYCLQLGKDYGEIAYDKWEARICTYKRYIICEK